MSYYTQSQKEVFKNSIYLINKIFILLLASGMFILIHNSNILSMVNYIIITTCICFSSSLKLILLAFKVGNCAPFD